MAGAAAAGAATATYPAAHTRLGIPGAAPAGAEPSPSVEWLKIGVNGEMTVPGPCSLLAMNDSDMGLPEYTKGQGSLRLRTLQVLWSTITDTSLTHSHTPLMKPLNGHG